jgi:hypothetical protein
MAGPHTRPGLRGAPPTASNRTQPSTVKRFETRKGQNGYVMTAQSPQSPNKQGTKNQPSPRLPEKGSGSASHPWVSRHLHSTPCGAPNSFTPPGVERRSLERRRVRSEGSAPKAQPC